MKDEAAHRSCPTGFVVVDVRLVTQQHLHAACAVGHHGQQVAHGARGHKEGCLFVEELCSRGLEGVERGVFSVHIVA